MLQRLASGAKRLPDKRTQDSGQDACGPRECPQRSSQSHCVLGARASRPLGSAPAMLGPVRPISRHGIPKAGLL